MKAQIDTGQNKYQISYRMDEESLWKQVAEAVYTDGFNIPSIVTVKAEQKLAQVKIDYEIDPDKTKEEVISIQLLEDGIRLPKSVYREKRLRHIDKKNNVHTRYDMNPNNMGPRTLSIGVISGEIGKKGHDRLENGYVHSPFPSQLFWLRYYQKINNGYKDYTEELKAEDDENKINEFFKKPDERFLATDEVVKLYEFLTDAAKQNLASSGIEINFFSNSAPYTKRQVNSVRKIYEKMCAAANVGEINEVMQDFLAVTAPTFKKGTTVKSFMVETVEDEAEQLQLIQERIDWANSMVSSMEAIIAMNHKKSEVYESPFGNISIRKETDEEMKETITGNEPWINPIQSSKIIAVYDVIPYEQKERYEEYLKTLEEPKESLLFHGSTNCNWISIIKNGLQLNPNARICGKAYGHGTYFANDSDKSAGYGSQKGSCWAKGDKDYAVMGIYRVATGNEYDPGTSIIGGDPEKTKELLEKFKKEGYDSLHYHAGKGTFRRDEIVVYNEKASCLSKLLIYAS